jgi:hypothetical protein
MEACLNPFFAKTQILVQFYGKALGPSRRNGEVEVAGELEIEVLSLLPCLGGGVGNPAPPPMFPHEMLWVNLFPH